jgi:hypothetical protein
MRIEKNKKVLKPKALYSIDSIVKTVENIGYALLFVVLFPIMLGGVIFAIAALGWLGLYKFVGLNLPIALIAGAVGGVLISLWLDDAVFDQNNNPLQQERSEFIWLFVFLQVLTLVGICGWIAYTKYIPFSWWMFVQYIVAMLPFTVLTWLGDDDTVGALHAITMFLRVQLYWFFRQLDAVLTHTIAEWREK